MVKETPNIIGHPRTPNKIVFVRRMKIKFKEVADAYLEMRAKFPLSLQASISNFRSNTPKVDLKRRRSNYVYYCGISFPCQRIITIQCRCCRTLPGTFNIRLYLNETVHKINQKTAQITD